MAWTGGQGGFMGSWVLGFFADFIKSTDQTDSDPLETPNSPGS